MPRHLSAAGFRASLGLLSDLDKSLDGDTEWLFLGTGLAFGVGRLMGSVILFPWGEYFCMMSTHDVPQVSLLFAKAAVLEEHKESFPGGFVPLFCVQVSREVYRLLFSSETCL